MYNVPDYPTSVESHFCWYSVKLLIFKNDGQVGQLCPYGSSKLVNLGKRDNPFTLCIFKIILYDIFCHWSTQNTVPIGPVVHKGSKSKLFIKQLLNEGMSA